MSKANCFDCGLEYGHDGGFEDLVIPTHIWRKISPTGDEGGLLCANCICARLTEKGISGVPAAYMSGPIDTVSRHLMWAHGMAENLLDREEHKSRLDKE